MVVDVGINGFGRIGKCLFLQILESPEFCVKAVNCSISAQTFAKYINTDSVHGNRNHDVTVIDAKTVSIKGRSILLLTSRKPEELPWRECGVTMLFETTGAFLTTQELKRHEVDYVVLSAPPKDLGTTPMFVYGVNDRDYAGERVVSIASCTTNCIAPFLAAAQNIAGGIDEGSFLTVHAATASQSIVDEAHDGKRTNRSIFNNMIPHSTGASKTVDLLLPQLKGRIVGTSIRIPVSNVSMLDLNLHFNEAIEKEDFLEQLEDNTKRRYGDTVVVHRNKGVSSDFITQPASTIVDFHQTFQLSPSSIKFCLWYDNEWSYSAQMLHMARTMAEVNSPKRVCSIRDVDFAASNINTVLVRTDYNCPLDEATGEVADDYRVRASIPTIEHILKDNPRRMLIATHFGRPKPGTLHDPASNLELSTERFVPILSRLLKRDVKFLPKGFDSTEGDLAAFTQELAEASEELKVGDRGTQALRGAGGLSRDGPPTVVYLCENTRFHAYETKPPKEGHRLSFGVDVFVNEAFSVSHRAHFSVTGVVPAVARCVGFQLLREVHCLDRVLGRSGETSVAIIGGAKVSDKVPMLCNLARRVDLIVIGGNNVNAIVQEPGLLDPVRGHRAEILLLDDGFGHAGPDGPFAPMDEYPPCYALQANGAPFPLFDAGPAGLNKLSAKLHGADIVFWNGALGVTEHPFYRNGSEALVHLLRECKGDVVIGGGDTAGFVGSFEGGTGNDLFYHVSTGGGASIEYLSQETLVGIAYHSDVSRKETVAAARKRSGSSGDMGADASKS